ncbi:MAG: hypothetical protein JRJ04_02780 [Deltaproteobacteria bacterium]|nr:hypothetical protein [Deltaproteobacteria bacterium]
MKNRIKIKITERISFADGHKFEKTGPYERLTGRVYYEIDPRACAEEGIVDIDKAPINAEGLVKCAGDIFILKPVDMACGNRRLLFGYGNRGNKRALQFFNDAPASNDPVSLDHAGNGFLMRRGYTIVWGAWEGDLLPGDGRMILQVPVATDNGTPITGLVRSEFIADRPGITCFPLSGRATTRSYPAVSLDPRDAKLTMRRYAEDDPIPVPPESWMFARIERDMGIINQEEQTGLVPSDTHIYMPGGFTPGWIYELVYTGRDPLVLGLGHVVVRELVSFLRYGTKDSAGQANPLGEGTIEKAYAWGRSQAGRCIRDFLWRGFNADASGRKVFDGVLPHVSGAGLMWMNQRFASVVSPAGQQYENHYNYADHFPFSYAWSTDHHTGKRDAILKRPDTDPFVIHTQSSTEYWQRRGSLVHTDTGGNDLPQPETVRLYLWSSSQHFADPNTRLPERGVCRNYANIVQTSMLFRAMLDVMDRWVTEGIPPPPSRIPTRNDGTLVSYEQWLKQFPNIPGVAIPQGVNRLPLLDFGQRAEAGIFDKEPPEVIPDKEYPVFVPAVDEDGIELSGVRAPMVQAPLGTYTGWNLRSRGFGTGAMHLFTGSYIPFSDSPQERKATGDPRLSVIERYKDASGYLKAVEAAARQLVAEGFMLEEDVHRAVEAAFDWGRPLHDVRLPIESEPKR